MKLQFAYFVFQLELWLLLLYQVVAQDDNSLKYGHHDPNHIREHLDGVVDVNKDLNKDEEQFHYFKIHDYNNDNMLDGNELIVALTDYHKGENNPDKILTDDELSQLVDTILKEDDRDSNGYIDYAEFMMSQRT